MEERDQHFDPPATLEDFRAEFKLVGIYKRKAEVKSQDRLSAAISKGKLIYHLGILVKMATDLDL